jgi:hypothetical protein
MWGGKHVFMIDSLMPLWGAPPFRTAFRTTTIDLSMTTRLDEEVGEFNTSSLTINRFALTLDDNEGHGTLAWSLRND